jgi:glycerophosphoryl diester phosphodiesterase
MPPTRSILGDTVRSYGSTWKTLALTDIAYKIVAFIVLTPLVGILFRVLLAVSGKTVLADQDILFFFLGPVGWVCAIALGGLWLGIVALEQAALMGVLCANHGKKRMGVIEALRFTLANAWPVIKVTGRIVAFTLMPVLPALAVAGVTYYVLLGEFDINFYLKEKPPEFLMALGIAGVIVLALAVVLLRLFTGWFFALQLVLFEGVRPANALRTSGERAKGQRRRIVVWIVGWALASMIVSAVATSLAVWIGHLIVPSTTNSLWLLAATVGLTMVLLSAVGLVVNLLSTTFFAAILFQLYRHLGSEGDLDLSPLDTSKTAGPVARFRITRARLLAGGILGVVAALGTGAFALHSVRLDDQVHIIAHRGSSMAAPENTLAAIKQAIEDGTDWVEIDVQETKDGEVVVFHDSDFMKLAGVNRKIWDVTLEDLKDIDVGSKFSPKFKDERVPTLGQVLEECKGKAGVNIELKYYGHDQDLEQRVVDIVEAHGMESEIVVMSLKVDAVKKMKKLRPKWTAGLLMSVSAGDLKNINADFLAVNAGFADRRFIRSAHGMGKDVAVWTVNDAPTMSSMIGRGVDGLITDKPALARSVLEQRAQMSPAERLMLEVAGLLGTEPEIGEQ